MEELEHRPQSAAGRLATERLTAAALDPELYPEGTAFIAADAPGVLDMIASSVREGRPVAIVYPDGREILATPTHGAVAIFVAAVLSWLGSRATRDRPLHQGSEVIAFPERYRVEVREPPVAA